MLLLSASPKNGNITEYDNWRGVILLSIPENVCCLIITNQTRDAKNGGLNEEQAGFSPKRLCANQIFKSTPQSVTQTSPNHSNIPTDPPCGEPRSRTESIQKIYQHSRRSVKTRDVIQKNDDGYNDWFHVATGVGQGCILSPLLFAMVLQLVTRTLCAYDLCLSDRDCSSSLHCSSPPKQPRHPPSRGGGQHILRGIGCCHQCLEDKNMLTGKHQPPTCLYQPEPSENSKIHIPCISIATTREARHLV